MFAGRRLVLAATPGTFGSLGVRDACFSFIWDILQSTPSSGHGLVLRAVASGTTYQFAADGSGSPSLCCVGTFCCRRVGNVCCSPVLDILQSTSAGRGIAIRSAVDFCWQRGSLVLQCRNVWLSSRRGRCCEFVRDISQSMKSAGRWLAIYSALDDVCGPGPRYTFCTRRRLRATGIVLRIASGCLLSLRRGHML